MTILYRAVYKTEPDPHRVVLYEKQFKELIREEFGDLPVTLTEKDLPFLEAADKVIDAYCPDHRVVENIVRMLKKDEVRGIEVYEGEG